MYGQPLTSLISLRVALVFSLLRAVAVLRERSGFAARICSCKADTPYSRSMESATSEFRNRLDGFQKEQLKHGREITCLCVECERLQFENKDLRRRLTLLEERLDRIEDNGRRNSLLFCGLPEDENESVFDFERKALNLIHRVLGVQKEVPIERVYRTGTAITVQFLSRKDRDLVLSSARHLRGSNLSVKEDVSPGVGQRRKGLALPLSDQQTRNQRKGTTVHHDNLVSSERVLANAKNSKNGVEVGVTEGVLVNALGSKNGVEIGVTEGVLVSPPSSENGVEVGVTEGVLVSAPSSENGVEVGVTEGVLVSAPSSENGVEVGVTEGVLVSAPGSENGVEVGVTEGVLVNALSSENGVEVGVTEENSLASALSSEDVKVGVTGAAELAGHCQRAPVPASRGPVARRESPRSDRGRLDPAREERRQVRRGTVHDVEASWPAVTNGSNSTHTCPSECLSSFHHHPGSCNSPDQREKETFGANLSACSGPPENDTATQNQHDPAEPLTNGDSKSLGDKIDNFYTGTIGREADDDVDAAMVKSPLSTFDGTEMFGEMSMDSGISTMTASMMSSSSGWGLSQSFQTASQSLSQSRSVTQLTSFPSSPVSPGDYVQPDSVKPAAADAGTGTPEGFIDSLLEGEGRCTHSDAFGTDCNGHISVKYAQAGRDIVGSSNPREGGSRCIEHSVGKHRERQNQHTPRRGPGVGWFSYLEGDGVHVDKEGLSQLTFELNSTQKRRHPQDCPREEKPGGSSHADFDCPRSGGDVYVSWNSPQLGECKHKDNRGEQPGDHQTWLGECKHKDNRGEQSAVSQAYICAQSEGGRVHTSNDSPQIGDWNHNSCNRTGACTDNYVSRDRTGGDTRAFSFTKADSPTEKGTYREYGEQFQPFENSQPGTLFDDSPEEGSFSDSSYEDIVPDVDGSLGRTLTADSPRGLQRRGGSVQFLRRPRGDRIHDQLQTETIPDSSQGRRTQDKIQAGVVSDGTPAGRVPDRLQGEAVVDSEREGRVHCHPQGETVLHCQGVGRDHDRLQGVPDKLQGPRIRDQAQAEKVFDSRREAKDHNQIQGETVLDSRRGGRVRDQLQREQVCQTGSTKKNKLSQMLSAGGEFMSLFRFSFESPPPPSCL